MFAFAVVVNIFVNAWMADAVGGFDNFIDVVGNAIDFAVGRVDSFELLHL